MAPAESMASASCLGCHSTRARSSSGPACRQNEPARATCGNRPGPNSLPETSLPRCGERARGGQMLMAVAPRASTCGPSRSNWSAGRLTIIGTSPTLISTASRMISSASSGAKLSSTARIFSWASSACTMARVSSGRSAMRFTTMGSGDCIQLREYCLSSLRKPGLGRPEWIKRPPGYSIRAGVSVGSRRRNEIGFVMNAPKASQSNEACRSGVNPRLPAAFRSGFLKTRSCLGTRGSR